MNEEKDNEGRINQLGLLQQNLEIFSMQKQQFENQKLEAESALNELEKAQESYKIIGNIMVSSDKDLLKKELEEKIETLSLRVKNLEKQEDKLKSKANEIQQEVLANMKKSSK